MDTSNYFIRTQAELSTDLGNRVNDASSTRWSVAQKYQALSAGVMNWGRRVMVPHLYTITGGYVSGTYIYALPYYIEGPIDVQYKSISGSTIGDTDATQRLWDVMTAFDVDVTSAGGRELRLHYDVYNTDGRIFWWGTNGPLPISATLPATSAEITATATSVTLTTLPTVGLSGYIKIGNEWIAYAGLTESGSALTLTNLTRAQFNTTAATHVISSDVYWGVAVPRPDLYEQLMAESASYLHLLNLNEASSQERGHHQDQMLYYKQIADEYWMRHAPERAAQLRLSRRAIGPGAGNADYRIKTGD